MFTPELAPYLQPSPCVESDAPAVRAFAARVTEGAANDRERAVRLFYAVRDEIRYDPYGIVLTPEFLGASSVLARGAGFCVAKAVVLAAAARAVGIPARLGFADVRNHLTTERLRAHMGTDVFVFHGFTELFLGGRWVKATPTFNRSLCDRFGVTPLEFDGMSDSLLHPFDAAGQRHMEYLRDRGTGVDVPFDEMRAVFAEYYAGLADDASRGDFEREAEADRARAGGGWDPALDGVPAARLVATTTAMAIPTRHAPNLPGSGIRLVPDMPICQTDLPIDWYQPEFQPYAEEYLALPDRLPETVLPWMDAYIRPALAALGERVMLLAHYYMGGEIVKLVERYGGHIADSYQLALQTQRHPEVKIFVESAVHFMAESIAILARPDQDVWITNPKSGCTMEMLAKDYMVTPVFDDLHARYGDDLLVIAYMNTSGRVKALAGRTGGAVCTSSNAKAVVDWALRQNTKIFFVPDRHLGEVVAGWCGLGPDALFQWPGGLDGSAQSIAALPAAERERLDRARMVLWGSFCGVHTVFTPAQVAYWRGRGYRVLAHPECPKVVVDVADGAGSTSYLWKAMTDARPGDKLAIATEGHFVRNARTQGALRGVEVVNLADVPREQFGGMGCGCATMSRNDPPHLVAILDLLRRGAPPDLNHVLPGDAVNEHTGTRERLPDAERAVLIRDARRALEQMIAITER